MPASTKRAASTGEFRAGRRRCRACVACLGAAQRRCCLHPACVGIYAADRLPVERLQKGARRRCLPMTMMYPPTTFMPTTWQRRPASPPCAGEGPIGPNVVDDSDLKMAEYFDLVARALTCSARRAWSRAEGGKAAVAGADVLHARIAAHRQSSPENECTNRLRPTRRGRGHCERKEKRMLVVKRSISGWSYPGSPALLPAAHFRQPGDGAGGQPCRCASACC